MFQKYCLPITIKLDSSHRFSVLLVFLYLIPLVPIFVALKFSYASLISLFVLFFLLHELKKQKVLRQYLSVAVNQKNQWHLRDADGNYKAVQLKSTIKMGSIIFLLFMLDGKSCRTFVFDRNQIPLEFHKLRVYLLHSV